MSHENVETLRAEYAAMSRRDWDAVLTHAHPDFELKTPSEGLDDGLLRGAENARRAFADFFGPYDSVSVDPEEFFEGDGQTVVFFVQRVRPSGSSGVLERRAAHLWSMSGGQVTKLEIFPRREEALEAAGLPSAGAEPDSERCAIVRRFEDCFTRGDLEGALGCVTTDFEFDWSNSIGPFVGIYEGHDGLTRFWNELREAWDHFSPHAEEILDYPPDHLVTIDVVRGRGKGSGIDMEAHGAMMWTLREGQIARVKMFQNKEAALEALGLA